MFTTRALPSTRIPPYVPRITPVDRNAEYGGFSILTGFPNADVRVLRPNGSAPLSIPAL
jgi:hypothetical protein